MTRLLTIWHRLFHKPEAQLVPIRFVQVGISTEEHEADWRAGYTVGRAQGQLEGRQALAGEIEQEFGLHAGQEPMNADDAARIKVRQVH